MIHQWMEWGTLYPIFKQTHIIYVSFIAKKHHPQNHGFLGIGKSSKTFIDLPFFMPCLAGRDAVSSRCNSYQGMEVQCPHITMIWSGRALIWVASVKKHVFKCFRYLSTFDG